MLLFPGDAVAKFASQNVHKRLINEESYREKQYEKALKRAFIGTDEDILASEQRSESSLLSAIPC
jgi:protein phosphatase PTC2/3